ncbi:aldose 1-epimerase family protein [Amycolatopsis acidiphila]|uniref:DUF4432 family protein n=1 Tax=Amycolatopsis acidiphila TaxID=715473 RepID=UPI0016438FBC|nr:DUF4432 family protein [Amycolatopsis acidiphila]UIJ60423.1 aldose 1-epimerase family protein [Amycolatopsis acidiphila]
MNESWKDTAQVPRSWEARESLVANGSATGCRQLEVRVEDGVDLRILPDRGFDIGQAWWRGRPLGWVDASRERPPDPDLSGTEWIGSFSGGLLTTCGLRHIGQPRDGHGLHGKFSHQRARMSGAASRVVEGETVVTASAVVEEPGGFDALFTVEREITTRTGVGQVEISDFVTNQGASPELLKLLYHLNLPHPKVGDALNLDGRPLDADVLRLALDTVELPASEESRLEIVTAERSLSISWRRFSRLYLWAAPAAVGPVLAVELATASLVPSGESGLVLEPGEKTEFGLSVCVRESQQPRGHSNG